MVQAPRALGILTAWREGPAAGGHLPQLWPWRGRWQVPASPLPLPAFAGHGARAEPPARRAGGDAMRAGRPRRAARGPGPPQGSKLLAEDPVSGRPPGEGRPAVCWQGLEYDRGLIPRRRARRLRLAALSWALPPPWHGAPWPRGPEDWRATPPARRPGWGRPGASRTRRPGGGRCATQAVTRCWARAWGSQGAAVQSGGQRAVAGPATAAAMVAQGWRGRAVRNPVRARSTRARLVARRKRGAQGAREVASAGRVAGLAFGPPGVFIGDKYDVNVSQGEYGGRF